MKSISRFLILGALLFICQAAPSAAQHMKLQSTDSDGDFVVLSVVSVPGPPFLTVIGDDSTPGASARSAVTVAGTEGAPPTLELQEPIAVQRVVEGATLDLGIAGRAEADSITLSSTGPYFMTLTMRPQALYARGGTIHLAPPFGTVGTYSASVTVAANSKTASQGFTIEVVADRAPLLDQPQDMTVSAGTTADQALYGWDPDQQSLWFSLVSGPSYATVTTVNPSSGNGSGNLHLAPGKSDTGTASASVTVSDGLRSESKTLAIVVGIGAAAKEPRRKAFGRASPNPFNPSTTISFELAQSGRVRMRIYDVSGRLVSTLSDRVMGVGPQEVRWDATSVNGSRVPSGVYFYVLETPGRAVRGGLVVAK